jgi:hypothetical protein
LDFLRGRPATGLPSLLIVQEVARILRCSVSSLNKWRLSGRGPRFVRVGSRVRYRPPDVADWIAHATRRTTSESHGTTPSGTANSPVSGSDADCATWFCANRRRQRSDV